MSDVSAHPKGDAEARLRNLKPKVLIIDCIDTSPKDEQHPAHFNITAALECAMLIQPERTYLTGIHHNTSHQTYLWLLDKGDCDPAEADKKYVKNNSDFEHWNQAYLTNLRDTKTKVQEILGDSKMIVKPAYDGLCITISEDGTIRDDDDNWKKSRHAPAASVPT